MADAKSNTSPDATPAERLERLLHTCHSMQKNLSRLISALDVVDNAIPDRDDTGLSLSDLVQMIINHQNEEYTDFVQEIRIAEGEAA